MAKSNIKRPRITEVTRGKVLDLHREGLKPTAILKALKGEKNGPVLSLRSIQTITKTATDATKKPEYQQFVEPWHLGLLDDYPMPAEAVAIVLNVGAKWEYMTIRQVLWVGRLYRFLTNVEELEIAASFYADFEHQWLLAGRDLPADTTFLDAMIREKSGRGTTDTEWSLAFVEAQRQTARAAIRDKERAQKDGEA